MGELPDEIDVKAIVKQLNWNADTLDAFLYGAEIIKDGLGIEAVKELEAQSVEEEEYHLAEGYKRCLIFMNLCLLVNRIEI